jgi:uncharacterized protein
VLAVLSSEFSLTALVVLGCILALSAIMSGLSGFGFSAVGALCLWLVPPKLGVPLLMTLSSVNQLLSLRQLRADLRPLREWWPEGPAPYLLGGLLGVPLGLSILHILPTVELMAIFGGFLVLYATYSILKPEGLYIERRNGWPAAALVGMAGGVIGGFTAFPGATVVVWSGLRRHSKAQSRSIVQPYILGLQLVSLATLALGHPETFSPTYWALLMVTVPIVLPCTLLGVELYELLSDLNFRRLTFMLLGTSGVGLLIKATGAITLVAVTATAVAR